MDGIANHALSGRKPSSQATHGGIQGYDAQFQRAQLQFGQKAHHQLPKARRFPFKANSLASRGLES